MQKNKINSKNITSTSISLITNKTKAFTLVELIVVVTILAILATIGFVSYSSYLTGVRDTNRLAQIVAIHDGLELYSTKKKLPLPDSSIEIKANGKVISYQGYVGKNVLETIDFTKGGLDPKDDNYFSYYLTKNRRSFQMLAFLEEEENLQSNNTKHLRASSAFATDYTDRIPTVYGKKLGILTSTGTNTPIQEIASIILTGALDIGTTTTSYTAHLTDLDTLTGDSTTLATLEQISKVGGGLANSCASLLRSSDILESGLYSINPSKGKNISVYCDMKTNGGGRTRTHILQQAALPSSNTEAGYKGMFSSDADYGSNGFRFDISDIEYSEFAYLTDDSKSNVEYLKNGAIKTVGNSDEGFSEWIVEYGNGECRENVSPIVCSNSSTTDWYYYEDLNKTIKETLSLLGSGYRNMASERLFRRSGGGMTSGRQSTNYPFGKNGLTGGWCYGGKNNCSSNGRSVWASLWIR